MSAPEFLVHILPLLSFSCSVNCCKAHKLVCKSFVVDKDQTVPQMRRTEHVDITTSDVVAGEQLKLLSE